MGWEEQEAQRILSWWTRLWRVNNQRHWPRGRTAVDLNELAIRLGVARSSLAAMLTLLLSDVASDTNHVGDDHPRFGEHVVLIAWAGEMWQDVEREMDEAATSDDPTGRSNRLERGIIARAMQQVA